MATLLIDNVNDRIAVEYEKASEEEKQLVKQMIEDMLSLWTLWKIKTPVNEQLKQKAIAFALNHQTFPLDWSSNRLTREELNER